jgi:hypothetical protein
MALVSKNRDSSAAAGWVQDEVGYQRTSSRTIINNLLKSLMKKRRFLCLRRKDGYQSGNTVLVEVAENRLAIDKPVDWPGGGAPVTLIFRDDHMLINHCTVKVTAVTTDTVYTAFPGTVYQLQRRSHYRVGVPRASRASMTVRGEYLPGFFLHDISASGILVSRRDEQLLAEGDELSDISLDIAAEDGRGATVIAISQGEVTRTFTRSRTGLYYAGIKLLADCHEEETLLRYVRKRELELLRR